MDDIAIKVENVSKVYKLYDKPMDRLKESIHPLRKKYHNNFYALKDINFKVKKGETLGIIGKNGSGKSTLLKLITGVLTPTTGVIKVNGRVSALLELGAGFNMEFSGIQNIYLNGTIMGYSKSEMDTKLKEILDFADIGEFIHQPVKTYSSGMFVRLAFAVAINVNPEVLIVDEALSVGDIFFQAKCYNKFEEFKKEGKTIIFVTHDLGSILKYCDRTIVINNGEIVSEGTPSKMVDVFKRILVNLYAESGQQEDTKNPLENLNAVWKNSMIINPNHLNYGNGKAEIYDFGLFDSEETLTNTIMKGKEFVLKLKVIFKASVKDPIFAFTIKDLKGTEITGTNTMLEYVNTGLVQKDKVVKIEFKQEMILQGGNYLVSFGCTGFENNEFVVYHRLYDIFNITVLSDKNSVGFFDLYSKVNMSYFN